MTGYPPRGLSPQGGSRPSGRLPLLPWIGPLQNSFCNGFLDKVRADDRPQHGLGIAVARAAGKPPQRAFLDVPVGWLSRKQPGRELPQRRLVADQDDRALALRPVAGGDEVGDIRLYANASLRGVGQIQRCGGLLRALGRARQDETAARQPRFEPLRHLLCLLQPFLVRARPASGIPVFGVGVTPEQQLHSEFSLALGHAGRSPSLQPSCITIRYTGPTR